MLPRVTAGSVGSAEPWAPELLDDDEEAAPEEEDDAAPEEDEEEEDDDAPPDDDAAAPLEDDADAAPEELEEEAPLEEEEEPAIPEEDAVAPPLELELSSVPVAGQPATHAITRDRPLQDGFMANASEPQDRQGSALRLWRRPRLASTLAQAQHGEGPPVLGDCAAPPGTAASPAGGW